VKALQFLAYLFCVVPTAAGFDTGHHRDLTWSALRAEGFGEGPTNIAIMANWLPDYYAAIPRVDFPLTEASKRLHFDNLNNAPEVEHYWSRLAQNTKIAVQVAAAQKYSGPTDPFAVLEILGTTLHAVQDFYAHSNWNELLPKPPESYSGTTWWNYVDAKNGSEGIQIYTGYYKSGPSNGKPPKTHDELNKDHYGRPHWDEAYVFAYVASRQWIRFVKQWVDRVDPTLWRSVQDLDLGNQFEFKLRSNLDASYGISAWFILGGGPYNLYIGPGHWKGPGSAWLRTCVVSTIEFDPNISWMPEMEEAGLYTELAEGLYERPEPLPSGGSGVVPVVVPPIQLDERVVDLVTTKASVFDDPFACLREPELCKDGVFAITDWSWTDWTVSGPAVRQKFSIETKDVPLRGFAAASIPWQSLIFVSTSVPVLSARYALWTEGDWPPVTNSQWPPKNPPAGGSLTFTFTPATNVCAGDITTCSNDKPADIKADGKVSFYVKVAPIVPTGPFDYPPGNLSAPRH
jgi:hypothetical protein